MSVIANWFCDLFGYSNCNAMSTFESILLSVPIIFIAAVLVEAIAEIYRKI